MKQQLLQLQVQSTEGQELGKGMPWRRGNRRHEQHEI
jgi:hypothetical protein